jgi:hypothetical protein
LARPDEIGNDERRRRSPVLVAIPIPGRGEAEPPAISLRTVVFVEAFRATIGRIDVLRGVPAPLPASLRGIGESLRTDKAECVR